MKIKTPYLIILLIIILSFAIGGILYPHMPEQVASHWNAQGEVNDYVPKILGLFLMPTISIIIFLLLLFIPKIDPLKKNVEKFRKHFDNFIILIIVFLFYIHLLTLLWNLNYKFDMTQAMMPALGILFFYIGVMIQHAKRNWFIGIRTPWTLSSDTVWNKTHKIGGKMFKVSGIVVMIGILFPQWAFYFILIPVMTTTVYTILYSYFEFKKLSKKR
ncbi:MAG: SdpI family protein [Parcubacteria group bacterium]|nr:SdpI family protein [Parcubacteria group bacterium]